MKKKLGIDIDEVIVKFLESILTFYNLSHNKNISKEQIKSYNFWENGIGNTREEAIKIVDDYFQSPQSENIELIDNAKESITELSKKYDIYFITSRNEKHRNKTTHLIERNFRGLYKDLIFSSDFHKGNGKSKAEVCKDLGINYFIEDNFQYAKEMSDIGIETFLMSKRWNIDYEHQKIKRVNNWEEIMETLG